MNLRLLLTRVLIVILPACAAAPGQTSSPAGTRRADWTGANPVTRLTAATFAAPPAVDRPWVRMNMPASAEPAEIATEVRQLFDAGITGIEIGQGAFPNNAQLVALLEAANRLGVKVSLSHGPTQSPAGYSIDDEHARKTLLAGKATVKAGEVFDGPVPAPALTQGSRSGFGGRPGAAGGPPGGPGGPGPGGPGGPGPGGPGQARGPQPTRATLIAALAFRCAQTPCPATGPATLDRSSMVDLMPAVTGRNTAGYGGGTTTGQLRWTAPAGGQWLVLGFWARGAFAQPDPFSDEGYAALTRGMDAGLSDEVKALLKANGGDIFYDSHSVDRGSPDELWTNRMAEEFRGRRKYDLIPNLPALFREHFDFNDGSAARVREDFYAVRGDLWLEKQIAPLRQWVRKYNNVLRVQVEGEANLTIPITDMVQAAAAVDRPEYESLFVGDEIDNYLPMASANHMTGNSWYSTECCPTLNRNYAQTFQDLAIKMHRSFAGGITRLIYHVYPYRDGATWKWPGYHNFGQAGFSNAWGPRAPHWVDARLYNDYFARLQQALTQGDAKADVAVYMQNYLYPPSQGLKFRHWGDAKLEEAGYTRDYLNPQLLALPGATVSGGRLAAQGPAYKALVIDSEQGPATDPVKTSMPVETARRILSYARAGLPVIVVGQPPERTPGRTPEQDDVLRAVIGELLAERSVSRVAHEADVPGKLQALGIRPAADPGQPSSLLSVRRRDSETRTDYYFFYNQGTRSPEDEPLTLFEPATGQAVEREVSLEGRGQPYRLDAWSGRITPIARYTTAGGRVTFRIRVSPDNATLVALSDDPKRFGVTPPGVWVTATNADGAAVAAEGIVIRAAKAGRYDTTLSNGKKVRSEIREVPGPIDLTRAGWHLSVEDWQPANPYATTFGAAAAQTRRTRVDVDLKGLAPWTEISELKDTSGTGVYSTSFDLPKDWTPARAAVLSLGEVFDTFTVTVNGQPVVLDQMSAEGDIGSYLKAGRNTIQVRVATTINNRLAQLDADVARRGLRQPYGLAGPVTIRPLGTAPAARKTRSR